jgi:hypothetical protein
MVHPCSGCNYADHVLWALHATNYLPANKASCAAEANWDKPTAPAIDADSAAFPAPPEPATCDPGAGGYASFTAHVLYNPLRPAAVRGPRGPPVFSPRESRLGHPWHSQQVGPDWTERSVPLHGRTQVQAKALFIHGVESIFAAYAPGRFAVGVDQPRAYADPRSPMLTATQPVHLNFSSLVAPPDLGGARGGGPAAAAAELQFAAFVQWVLQQQSDAAAGEAFGTDYDVVLQPHSGCAYSDLVSRAMYAGAKWQLNEHALLPPLPPSRGGAAVGLLQRGAVAAAGGAAPPLAGRRSPAAAEAWAAPSGRGAARPTALAASRGRQGGGGGADESAPACRLIRAAADEPVDFVLYFMAGATTSWHKDTVRPAVSLCHNLYQAPGTSSRRTPWASPPRTAARGATAPSRRRGTTPTHQAAAARRGSRCRRRAARRWSPMMPTPAARGGRRGGAGGWCGPSPRPSG